MCADIYMRLRDRFLAVEIWKYWALMITGAGLTAIAALIWLWYWLSNESGDPFDDEHSNAGPIAHTSYVVGTRTASEVGSIDDSSSTLQYSDDEEDSNYDDNNTGSDILSSLPDAVVDEEKSNLPGGSGRKECAICLQEYETGETIKWLPCMHSYHETCVATWFRQCVVCPLCKFHPS